eukprot:126045-Rhodomonas_salina.6
MVTWWVQGQTRRQIRTAGPSQAPTAKARLERAGAPRSEGCCCFRLLMPTRTGSQRANGFLVALRVDGACQCKWSVPDTTEACTTRMQKPHGRVETESVLGIGSRMRGNRTRTPGRGVRKRAGSSCRRPSPGCGMQWRT